MIKTRVLTSKEINRQTHTIDAKGQILGKLAVTVASLLMGKHKVLSAANLVAGDKVTVTNASQIAVTGKKTTKKTYQHHSGYPGGFRIESFEHLQARKPTEIIRLAVWGMLPVNKLRDDRIKNLKIFAGEQNDGK